ncbi:RNA polymerase sigma factor (sigma-70 family) [Catalinimonas alkaloidigena]|uniref:RNA polymerase sigma factor n=1 Tax=Catalinimonas alkaloidigena TaxID=1075417 RepID=UPI002405469C|nr:sigma-70 family RNA polymerase sigma factor [Catalinimonas alkaloidigena]MDF9799610.1 RNA polymerase sigma factor (sigma-70 family) [Catalinimonas alkaloidigena]
MMKEQIQKTTDEDLWSAFREGSENAFDLIYGKMFPVLFNYGFRICQDEEQVKDCIQNIFIEIWQKRDQIKEVYSLKHYFLKIMRRKVFRALKSKKEDYFKLFNSGLGKEQEDNLISFLPSQFATEDDDSYIAIKKMRKAVEYLSSRKREAILLKFYENLSYAEISEVMELRDPKYARQLVYRSLDDLRESLHVNRTFSISSCNMSTIFLLSFLVYLL